MDKQVATSETWSVEAQSSFIRRATGYSFHNRTLLEEALNTKNFRSNEANRRLAMVGASRIQDIILDDWLPTGTPTSSSRIAKKSSLYA